MKRLAAVVAAALSSAACSGTTGSDLVEFDAFAAGPSDAQAGAAYRFFTDAGYEVTLQRATLHLGALYLNRSAPVLGSQETNCILPGVYAAQVTSGVTFDALSPEPVLFPVRGRGTSDRAVAGEVWLTGGRVDALDDKTVILDFAGVAVRGAESFPFDGKITIGTNRMLSSGDPAQPGANPLCKERIVSPIPIDITPTEGGRLIARANPAAWFDRVDFAQLPPNDTEPPSYTFTDAPEGQPALTLFQGLHQITSAFFLEWSVGP